MPTKGTYANWRRTIAEAPIFETLKVSNKGPWKSTKTNIKAKQCSTFK